MLNLIKLELKKNNIRTYLFSAAVITVVMLGFLYLFAAIPYMEPNAEEASSLSSYSEIMGITALLNMVSFCVLSAVMYSRFVIEEYRGKYAIMLFSYPISRRSVFLSKLMLVSIFTIVGLIVSNCIIFAIFLATEAIFPLMKDTFTLALMTHLFVMTISMSVLAVGLGIISMAIGFARKSVPTAIVASVIFCSLISNVGTSKIIIIAALLSVAIGAVVTSSLLEKIKHMEV